jgi:hypothetical protein
MKRYLTGVATLALGMALALALAAGPAGPRPAAAAGVKVVPWKPVRGKLLWVNVKNKSLLVRTPGGLHQVSLASGVQLQLRGGRQTLSDLSVLRRFLGQPVIVAPEANGLVLIVVLRNFDEQIQ